ncbi:MAG: hypothetical protein WD469_14545 [Paenibacillaceae bacterium]
METVEVRDLAERVKKNIALVIVGKEQVIEYLVIIVLSAAALYLIYIIGKKLIRLGMLWYNWLKRRLDQGEVNQITDWLEQLSKREVKWSDLTINAERARYLYRLFVMKSLNKDNKLDSHLTAQENDLGHSTAKA